MVMLADRLQAQGHQVTFAMRDLTCAESALGRFEYIQAPLWRPRPSKLSLAPSSYAEILEHYGYVDRYGLLSLVKAWRTVFRWTAPDLVVFDHAPTALLAARGLKSDRVLYGVGFSSPPRVAPLPNFRTWTDVSPKRLEASESVVLKTINWVLGKLSLEPLAALFELFHVEDDFLCTFPELDHYGGRPASQYCGTVFDTENGAQPVWPDGGGKKIWVYIRPDMRSFHPVAKALSASAHSVLWIAPGLDSAARRRYESRALKFVSEPVHLARAAAEADAAVLYGGHGTVSAMLLAGVPMVLYPNHVEQMLVSQNVAKLGACPALAPRPTAEDVAASTESVLRDTRYRQSANAFASKYAGFDPHRVVDSIAGRIEHRLAGR
ncbi:MAG: glycosyltransferase [Burkholderiales bacterium]